MKLLHAFSPTMLTDLWGGRKVHFQTMPLEAVKTILDEKGIESNIGHNSIATILTKVLGQKVDFCRQKVTINPGDRVIVSHYSGPRLDEDAKEIPPEGCLRFISVEVLEDIPVASTES